MRPPLGKKILKYFSSFRYNLMGKREQGGGKGRNLGSRYKGGLNRAAFGAGGEGAAISGQDWI